MMEGIFNLIVIGFAVTYMLNRLISWELDKVLDKIKDIEFRLSNIEKRLDERTRREGL